MRRWLLCVWMFTMPDDVQFSPANAMALQAGSARERDVAIAIRGLTKTYPGGVNAVRNIDLDILQGEMLAIMGKSGSGKSTLLNLIGSLDKPEAGSVEYHGVDLRRVVNLPKFRREEIGFVFQLHYLLPHLTLLDNVALPLFGQAQARSPGEQRAGRGRVGAQGAPCARRCQWRREATRCHCTGDCEPAESPACR